jgi:hypothetical protein
VLKSSVEIVNDAIHATSESENSRVAHMWLRLSRIAILELPHWQRRVNGRPLDQGTCRNRKPVAHPGIDDESARTRATCPEQGHAESGVEQVPPSDKVEFDHLTSSSIEAWHRILSRVVMVTDARLDDSPVDVDVDGSCAPNEGTCLPRERPSHVCLGDMLEESVSWLDVDSEDDQTSPKQADLMQAYNEAMEEEMAEERAMPRGFEAIARQQKAPGIVEGMCKCLSF